MEEPCQNSTTCRVTAIQGRAAINNRPYHFLVFGINGRIFPTSLVLTVDGYDACDSVKV